MYKSGLSFDARYDAMHDFLTPCGFLAVLAAVLRLHLCAVLWLAPPCSTWVWMSRSSTKRHLDTLARFETLSRAHLIRCPIQSPAVASRLRFQTAPCLILPRIAVVTFRNRSEVARRALVMSGVQISRLLHNSNLSNPPSLMRASQTIIEMAVVARLLMMRRQLQLRHRACKDVMGDPSNEYTQAQNALVARLCHLIKLIIARGCYWILEQPTSSVMTEHPLMADILAQDGVYTVRVELGCYNLECPKPIFLFGNAPYLPGLQRQMSSLEKAAMKRTPINIVCLVFVRRSCFVKPDLLMTLARLNFAIVAPTGSWPEGGVNSDRSSRFRSNKHESLHVFRDRNDNAAITAIHFRDASGNMKSRGLPELKATQAYPIGFGCAHGRCFAEHFKEAGVNLFQVGLPVGPPTGPSNVADMGCFADIDNNDSGYWHNSLPIERRVPLER